MTNQTKQATPMCMCGAPWTLRTVHLADNPCFVYDPVALSSATPAGGGLLIDETRALPYEAIRYVPGYPEQYVKEYAAACTKELREALKRLAEVYDAMGNPRGPALIAAEAALAASPVPMSDTGAQEPLRWNISSGGYRLYHADGSEVNPYETPIYATPNQPQSASKDAQPVTDPTDPGYDVAVLREHVRHLERRIRQLHAPQASQSAPGEAAKPFGWFYELDRDFHRENNPKLLEGVYLGGTVESDIRQAREPGDGEVFPLYTHPATTHSAPVAGMTEPVPVGELVALRRDAARYKVLRDRKLGFEAVKLERHGKRWADVGEVLEGKTLDKEIDRFTLSRPGSKP